MAILPPGGGTPPPATPPTGGQPQAATSVATTPTNATARAAAQALPPTLAQALAAPGASIEASVAGRNAAGFTTLNTPQGQIVLQTALTWPAGSGVALTLQNAGPPPVLGLALQPTPGGQAGGAQGQALGAASGQAPATGTPPGQGATAGGATGPAVLTSASQGIATTATVLSSTATPIQAAATPTQPPGATQAASLPGQPGAAGQAQGTVAGQPAGGAGAGPQPSQGAAGQTTLPQGSQVPVRVLALAPPGQPLAPLGAGALPLGQTVLTGQVLPGGPQGQTLIATPRGTLSLPMGSPPPGTQIALALTGQPSAPVGLDGAGRLAAMGEALRAVTEAANAGSGRAASALQTLQALTPQPGSQFAAAALFFLQATRGGQGARTWLGGATVDAIQAASGKAGASGLDTLGGTEGRARDAAGGDWRLTTLPFLADGRLEEIKLYRRPPEDGEDAADADAADQPVRFIVEARFSALGDIQLDTLTRPGHVDLMLRSLEPLSQEMRDDIRALFVNTISALGRAGEIGFQTVKRFDLVPVEEDHHGGTGETSA